MSASFSKSGRGRCCECWSLQTLRVCQMCRGLFCAAHFLWHDCGKGKGSSPLPIVPVRASGDVDGQLEWAWAAPAATRSGGGAATPGMYYGGEDASKGKQ
jgi:hypothetical protein